MSIASRTLQGSETFESTIQKTNEWLKDVMQEMGTDNRHRALLALRAVLHTLRDRLRVEEAAEFGAQLPLLVRGIYYEGWKPANKPLKERHKIEFLSHIYDAFGNDPDIDPEQIVRSVFRVFEKYVSRGEIRDIRNGLPPELRELWPEPAYA